MTLGDGIKKKSSANAKNRRRRPPIPYWSGRRRPPIPNFLKGEMEEARIQLQALAKDVFGVQSDQPLSPPKASLSPVKHSDDKVSLVTEKRPQLTENKLQDIITETLSLTPSSSVSAMQKLKQQKYSIKSPKGEEAVVQLPEKMYNSSSNLPSSRLPDTPPLESTGKIDFKPMQQLALKPKQQLAPKEKWNIKDFHGKSKMTRCLESLAVPTKSDCHLEADDGEHQSKPVDKERLVTQSKGLPESIVNTHPITYTHNVKFRENNRAKRSLSKTPKGSRRSFKNVNNRSLGEVSRLTPVPKVDSIILSQGTATASTYSDSLSHSETINTVSTFQEGSETTTLQSPYRAEAQNKCQVTQFSRNCIDSPNRAPNQREINHFREEIRLPRMNASPQIDAQSIGEHSQQQWGQQSNDNYGNIKFINCGNQQLGVTGFPASPPVYYFRPPGASMTQHVNQMQPMNWRFPYQLSNQPPGVIFQHQQTLQPAVFHQPPTTFYQPYFYQQQP